MNARWLNARVIIGWAVIKNILLKPFIRKDPKRWIARVAQDRLAGTPKEAWELLEQSSRCIGCRLCDAMVPREVQASAWIMGAIRQPEDASLALEKAKLLRVWAKEIEAVCPAEVGVASVAQLIELHAAALQKAMMHK